MPWNTTLKVCPATFGQPLHLDSLSPQMLTDPFGVFGRVFMRTAQSWIFDDCSQDIICSEKWWGMHLVSTADGPGINTDALIIGNHLTSIMPDSFSLAMKDFEMSDWPCVKGPEFVEPVQMYSFWPPGGMVSLCNS